MHNARILLINVNWVFFAKKVEESGGKWRKITTFVTLKILYRCKMRLFGNIEAKVDAKGRVFLPSAFRKELQAGEVGCLWMRKDLFERCLILYPEQRWNELVDAMRARLSPWVAREQLLYRQFVADTERVVLDGNGRFLIPRRYLQMADIEQSVRFIGMGDSIEIWSESHTQEPFVETETMGEALSMMMSDRPAEKQ